MTPAIQYAPTALPPTVSLSVIWVSLAGLDAGAVTVYSPAAGNRVFIHSVDLMYQGDYAGAGAPADPAKYALDLAEINGTLSIVPLAIVPRLNVAGPLDFNFAPVLDVETTLAGDPVTVYWDGGVPANVTTTAHAFMEIMLAEVP